MDIVRALLVPCQNDRFSWRAGVRPIRLHRGLTLRLPTCGRCGISVTSHDHADIVESLARGVLLSPLNGEPTSVG